MRIILSSYLVRMGREEGEEEEVEFSPDMDADMDATEHFVNIRMGNKIARVKADELKKVVEAST